MTPTDFGLAITDLRRLVNDIRQSNVADAPEARLAIRKLEDLSSDLAQLRAIAEGKWADS